MNTNQMFAIMDFIMVGAGLYLMFAWYLLQFKGEIKEGILIPKGVNQKSCNDREGFRAYMGPRTLILGVMAMLSGGIGLYQDNVRRINPSIYWVFFFLFLAVLVWYTICSKKSMKKFFGM